MPFEILIIVKLFHITAAGYAIVLMSYIRYCTWVKKNYSKLKVYKTSTI